MLNSISIYTIVATMIEAWKWNWSKKPNISLTCVEDECVTQCIVPIVSTMDQEVAV